MNDQFSAGPHHAEQENSHPSRPPMVNPNGNAAFGAPAPTGANPPFRAGHTTGAPIPSGVFGRGGVSRAEYIIVLVTAVVILLGDFILGILYVAGIGGDDEQATAIQQAGAASEALFMVFSHTVGCIAIAAIVILVLRLTRAQDIRVR